MCYIKNATVLGINKIIKRRCDSVMAKEEKKISKNVAILLITAIVLAATTVVCVFLIIYKDVLISYFEPKTTDEHIAYNIESEMLTKPIDITTNLKVTDVYFSRHYINTSIALSTVDKKDYQIIEESKTYLSDIYTEFYNNLSYQEITELTIEQLKANLKSEIEKKLKVKINNVYITKFIIQ